MVVVAPVAVVAAVVVGAAVVAGGEGELQAFEMSRQVYGPQLLRLNKPHFPPH